MAELITLDTADLSALSVNQTFNLGSTGSRNLWVQVSGEDLDANDSTWEIQQSNDPNLDFELITGGDFTLTSSLQSIDLTNVGGTYLKLKLTSKGTATSGILHLKATIK